MSDNSRAINRVFTRNVLNDLLERGSSEVFDFIIKRYINDPESKTHGQLISEIYTVLGREKRNEYFYMNTLLNKLLCSNKHNVNTTTALSQLRIGRHIADFVMINGVGRVYEIKSELDNFDRLYDQLNDYYRAFSYVSVLASIDELERVRSILSTFGGLGEATGILVLTRNNTIAKNTSFGQTRSRNANEFTENLDHASLFKLLRKGEYENIVTMKFGALPDVAPAFYFKDCLAKFCEIPILEAQNLAFGELKKRNKIAVATYKEIQMELKSAVYFAGMTKLLPQISALLNSAYHGGN
jgi:hypothetical protein